MNITLLQTEDGKKVFAIAMLSSLRLLVLNHERAREYSVVLNDISFRHISQHRNSIRCRLCCSISKCIFNHISM